MESQYLDENPDKEDPPYPFPEDIVFGFLAFDRNGLVGSTLAGDQLPGSNHSGIDLRNGVDGLDFNGFSGDGSVRKEDEGVVIEADQASSVSESPVPPVAGEYSGEGLVSLSDVAVAKNGKGDCEFHDSVPSDFNVSSVADAPATNKYSGEGAGLNGVSKDLNFSNIWNNQGSLRYAPFGNHPHHAPNGQVDGFPVGRVNDMMSELTVRDLITSSNALALSAPLSPFLGLGGGQPHMNDIHLNSQMGHYAPPPTMTCLSLGCSSSPNSVLDPLELVNSYNGLFGRPAASNQYTHNIHLNGQVSPYTPPVRPMLTELSLGASSSLSNGLSGVHGKGKASAFRFSKMNRDLVELSMSRDGSLCLLDLMSYGNPKDIATILEAVASDVFTVMADEHGFKVFSNSLKLCDQTQKEFLLDRIISDSIGVILRAQTFHGSKALIEIVDHLKWSAQIHQVPSILATEIKPMVFDRFASSVIRHCLSVLKPKQNERLIEALIECSCGLALDVHRCSFLYNLIDRFTGVHKIRLFNKLADNSVKLAFHGSGNYVVKRILNLQETRISRKISYLLKGHYKSLAMDKHGSHVVEACLQSAGIHFVMDELLKMRPEELEELARHQFANYVITKALEATAKCSLSYHRELVVALLPGLARIKESPHGRNVYKQLKGESETRRRNGRARH